MVEREQAGGGWQRDPPLPAAYLLPIVGFPILSRPFFTTHQTMSARTVKAAAMPEPVAAARHDVARGAGQGGGVPAPREGAAGRRHRDVAARAAGDVHGDDYEMRALLRFAEEEAKHIQLFKWFVKEFEKGFGTACGAIGPAKEIAAAILNHSRLGVFLATLQIEWMTQKHYTESVKDNAAEGLDPLFSSLLKHHWLEESQHAKLDTLIVDKIASALEPAKIEAGIEDYMSIGKLLDGGLAAQVQLDLESLQKAIGRTLSAEEKAEIAEAQTKAYRWTFLASGMTHPNFDRSLRELSARGHERVEELSRAVA